MDLVRAVRTGGFVPPQEEQRALRVYFWAVLYAGQSTLDARPPDRVKFFGDVLEDEATYLFAEPMAAYSPLSLDDKSIARIAQDSPPQHRRLPAEMRAAFVIIDRLRTNAYRVVYLINTFIRGQHAPIADVRQTIATMTQRVIANAGWKAEPMDITEGNNMPRNIRRGDLMRSSVVWPQAYLAGREGVPARLFFLQIADVNLIPDYMVNRQVVLARLAETIAQLLGNAAAVSAAACLQDIEHVHALVQTNMQVPASAVRKTIVNQIAIAVHNTDERRTFGQIRSQVLASVTVQTVYTSAQAVMRYIENQRSPGTAVSHWESKRYPTNVEEYVPVVNDVKGQPQNARDLRLVLMQLSNISENAMVVLNYYATDVATRHWAQPELQKYLNPTSNRRNAQDYQGAIQRYMAGFLMQMSALARAPANINRVGHRELVDQVRIEDVMIDLHIEAGFITAVVPDHYLEDIVRAQEELFGPRAYMLYQATSRLGLLDMEGYAGQPVVLIDRTKGIPAREYDTIPGLVNTVRGLRFHSLIRLVVCIVKDPPPRRGIGIADLVEYEDMRYLRPLRLPDGAEQSDRMRLRAAIRPYTPLYASLIDYMVTFLNRLMAYFSRFRRRFRRYRPRFGRFRRSRFSRLLRYRRHGFAGSGYKRFSRFSFRRRAAKAGFIRKRNNFRVLQIWRNEVRPLFFEFRSHGNTYRQWVGWAFNEGSVNATTILVGRRGVQVYKGLMHLARGKSGFAGGIAWNLDKPPSLKKGYADTIRFNVSFPDDVIRFAKYLVNNFGVQDVSCGLRAEERPAEMLLDSIPATVQDLVRAYENAADGDRATQIIQTIIDFVKDNVRSRLVAEAPVVQLNVMVPTTYTSRIRQVSQSTEPDFRPVYTETQSMSFIVTPYNIHLLMKRNVEGFQCVPLRNTCIIDVQAIRERRREKRREMALSRLVRRQQNRFDLEAPAVSQMVNGEAGPWNPDTRPGVDMRGLQQVNASQRELINNFEMILGLAAQQNGMSTSDYIAAARHQLGLNQ